MPYTTAELFERLKTIPEIDLIELLDLTTEDLLSYLRDKIEEREDYIRQQLGLDG